MKISLQRSKKKKQWGVDEKDSKRYNRIEQNKTKYQKRDPETEGGNKSRCRNRYDK